MDKIFKMGESVGKKTDMLIGIIGLVLIMIGWYGITYSGNIISPKILPTPINVIISYGSMISDSDLLGNMWYSIKLNFIGYFYALIIAIPIGFIIGLFPVNNSLFAKYFNAIRYLPLPACSGIFIAIFGLAFSMKASFLAFGVLIYIAPIIIQRISELQNPANDKDYVYLQTIKTLGANDWQKFRYVYFPYVMSKVWVDVTSLVPISWTYVTIVEIFNKNGGLGSMISTFSRQSRTAEVFGILFLIIFIGIFQDLLFKSIDKLAFPYKHNKKPIGIKNFLTK